MGRSIDIRMAETAAAVPPPRAEPAFRTALWTGLALFFVALPILRQAPADNDASQYYAGARSLLAAGTPYALGHHELGLSGAPWRYCYPPLLAWLWLPLGMLEPVAANAVWLALGLAATAAFAGLLVRFAGEALRIGRGEAWALSVALNFGFLPTQHGLEIGQCHALLALLLAGTAACLERGRPTAAGALLALATSIKLFPGLLIPVLWRRGQRRAATVAGGLVLAQMAATASSWREFVRSFVLSDAYPQAAPFNVSLHGVAERLFRATDYTIPIVDSAWALGIAKLLLMAAAGAAAAPMLRRGG